MKRRTRLVAPWYRLLGTAVGLPAVMVAFGFSLQIFGWPLAHLSDLIYGMRVGR